MTPGPRHPADDERARRLLPFLQAAVPMWAARMAAWTPERRQHEAMACGDIIAHGADVLFRPGKPSLGRRAATRSAPTALTWDRGRGGAIREWRPAEIFNAIAKGLAIGALQPGGVTWLGQHWCTAPHGECPGVIPAAWLPGPAAGRPPCQAEDFPAAGGQ